MWSVLMASASGRTSIIEMLMLVFSGRWIYSSRHVWWFQDFSTVSIAAVLVSSHWFINFISFIKNVPVKWVLEQQLVVVTHRPLCMNCCVSVVQKWPKVVVAAVLARRESSSVVFIHCATVIYLWLCCKVVCDVICISRSLLQKGWNKRSSLLVNHNHINVTGWIYAYNFVYAPSIIIHFCQTL